MPWICDLTWLMPLSRSSTLAPKFTETSVSAISYLSLHLAYTVDLAARRRHVPLELLERHVSILGRQVVVRGRQVLHLFHVKQSFRRDAHRHGDGRDEDAQRRVALPVSEHDRHVVKRHLPDLRHRDPVLDEWPEQVLPEFRVGQDRKSVV